MKLDTFIINSYATLFIAFSLPAFMVPDVFAALLRYDLSIQGAKMEFIAAYGGLIFGAGILLAIMAKENTRLGLLSILCLMGSLFFGRLIGWFFDSGVSEVQITFLIVEFLTVIIVVTRLKASKQCEVVSTI